jgi:hypothetical protein
MTPNWMRHHFIISLQGLNYNNAVVQQRDSRPIKRKREDSEGRVRSSSKVPRDQSGVRDVKVCYLLTIGLLNLIIIQS